MFTDRLAIWTLGLEPDLWERATAAEQRLYRAVCLCFMLLTFFGILAAYTLSWLITSRYIATILTGTLLSYVISNIVRFSMITVRRSLYEKSHSPETAQSDSLQSKWQRIGSFLKNKTPEFATILRTAFMVIIIQLIVFPLIILINWDGISYENEKMRNQLVLEFKERNIRKINSEIVDNKNQIYQLQASLDTLNNQNPLTQKKWAELTRLKNTELQLIQKQDSINNIVTPAYAARIANDYYPVLSFRLAFKSAIFSLIESAVLALVLIPFVLLRKLRTNASYTYSEESTKHYRNLVFDDYNESLAFIEQKLKGFGVANRYNEIWADPPFCTVYIKKADKRQIIPIQALFNNQNSQNP